MIGIDTNVLVRAVIADDAQQAAHAARFPAIQMATIGQFGGWTKTQAVHFADDAIFDQITRKG